MQAELIPELREIWEKLHHVINSHDELYFFQKNDEMDALSGAANALRPLIYKYGVH